MWWEIYISSHSTTQEIQKAFKMGSIL